MRDAFSVLVFCRRLKEKRNVFKYGRGIPTPKHCLLNGGPGIAYSAACMLDLDSADGHVCLKEGMSTANAAPEWLRAEMARRCFWAVWFTRCIISDHCLTSVVFSDKMLNLPLPMDERSFAHSQQAPTETLSTLGVRSSKPSNTERQMRNSILAELMILMMYW